MVSESAQPFKNKREGVFTCQLKSSCGLTITLAENSWEILQIKNLFWDWSQKKISFKKILNCLLPPLPPSQSIVGATLKERCSGYCRQVEMRVVDPPSGAAKGDYSTPGRLDSFHPPGSRSALESQSLGKARRRQTNEQLEWQRSLSSNDQHQSVKETFLVGWKDGWLVPAFPTSEVAHPPHHYMK